MKKLIVLLIVLTTISCNINDDTLDTYSDPMPIQSVLIPEEFVLDEVYQITVTYIRPTTCHAFNNIYYQKHNNERTVVVLGTVFQNNGDCEVINTELEASLNFKATQMGSYIFNFWQGKDDNGEDIYLTVEVPVIS